MFKNKTAVITGAASGIGKALAFKCAKEGARLVLADNNETALQALEKEFYLQYPDVHFVAMDVCQINDVQRLLQETIDTFGSVELLFNNAGIVGTIGPIWTIPSESLQKIFAVNLLGMIQILQAFVPQMLKQNNACHIINTAAMSGLFTYPYFAPYQISKHAVIALSECLYHDLATKNSQIKVSVLCPGWVKTNIPNSLENPGKTLDNQLDSADLEWLISYGKCIKNGMKPEELADITFNALKENKFYIYTHPEMHEPVRQRFQAILGEESPAKFEV